MFRGAPRAETTTYVYDDAGRMTSSTTYHEASWTDVDRALALALAGVEADLCPCGCGHPVAAAHDDDNDGRFEVNADTTCYARKALDHWSETDGKHVNPGTLPYIEFHPAAEEA